MRVDCTFKFWLVQALPESICAIITERMEWKIGHKGSGQRERDLHDSISSEEEKCI